jgi:peptidoglycan/LPS O-acetylase OafA/YrhL
MGVLRILLAMSVVAAHSADVPKLLQFVGGELAVQIFFVISGFYMQLILSEGRYARARDFYTSRALRLFPAYLVVAALALLFAPAHFFQNFAAHRADLTGLLILSNLTIFLQDFVVFLSTTEAPVYQSLLVPQAWTLALELYFYILAPSLARLSTRWLIALAAASIGLRLFAYSEGFDAGFWTYRFFPFEIALFLIGMLSNRAYRAIHWNAVGGTIQKMVATACAVLMLASAWLLAGVPSKFTFIIAAATACALPFLFKLFEHNRSDAFIGELSYPLYIVHLFAIQHLASRMTDSTPSFLLSMSVSLISALAILLLIDNRMDKFRHKLTYKKKSPLIV